MPSTDPKWLKNHSEWVKQTYDGKGKLKVNPPALINSAKRHSGYNYEQLKILAGQVPIYYRSWGQLHEAFQLAIRQFGDERNHTHWAKIVQEIEVMSKIAGQFALNKA